MGSCCQLPTNLPKKNIAPEEQLESFGMLRSVWMRVGISLVLAGQQMLFGLGINLTPPTDFSQIYWILHGGLIISSLVVMFLLGPLLIRETWDALRNRQITVEGMFLLSALGAFVASILATVTGKGAVFYEVVSIVLSIYTIGKTLGIQSHQKAVEAIDSLREDFSHAFRIAPNGSKHRIPISVLRTGDEIWVGPGKAICVDGIIVEGESFVKETALTGEPEATYCGPGDSVLAGTYTIDGSLRIAAKSGKRLLDEILITLENARKTPCGWQKQANSLMKKFIPAVTLVSLATFAYWLWVGPWTIALFNSMSVLLVACPCALGLATPLAIWGGLSNLSAHSLIARSGQFLENICQINRIIFDKTGTLSSGNLSIENIQWFFENDPKDLEGRVAALQRQSEHPIAQAFCHWSPEGWEAIDLKIIPGRGISGIVRKDEKEHTLLLGTRDLMPENIRSVFSSTEKTAKKQIFVACDNQPMGIIYLEETFRTHLENLMDNLRAQGLQLTILTGDAHFNKSSIAGVEVISGLTSTQKSDRVKEYKTSGELTLFVGDGINDANAMNEAHLSIAMGSGTALAKGISDAVLMGENLEIIAQAYTLAHQIRSKIHGNLIIASIYNAIGVALASAGYLHPVIAALIMVISSAIVSVRALQSAKLKS
jgi:heavy metal translocating P-type ATPase